MIHNVIIIGSGPAGLTAGIYTSRSKLNPLLIEGNQPGGQLVTSSDVQNWPGIKKTNGFELMNNIKEHAKACGCEFLSDNVERVDFSSAPYKIFTQSGKELQAESVIIATGASYRKLRIPGEQEYWSKGVSVCATCDGPFFKNKKIVVVGGGNTAVEEAHYLSNIASSVTILQNLEELTATDPLKDKVLASDKIEIIYNATAKEIKGDGQNVTSIVFEDQDGKEQEVEVDGVFVAIGMEPNTKIFKDQLELDKWSYIVKHDYTKTSKDGIFVAGDAADFKYKQAITASGQGCMAALDCEKFLSKK
jgi:thioredoxin reductase (NADPH)